MTPASFPTRKRLPREMINDFPLRHYDGPITLVTDPEDVGYACACLSRERVLGFDTETKPAFKKGQSFRPALLQLAGSDCVYLFQLTKTSLVDPLVSLLTDESIVKAGVAVRDDIKGLNAHRCFHAGGFVDLSVISNQHGFMTRGLRNMSANFLGFRIGKGAQRSNWGRSVLTRKQQVYAATDAWVSRHLYLCFQRLSLL
ncbi:3'-5' exonuclease [Desulfoplanes formicivorans]|uniref:3'-5' exonuclease n=1 Tax=Desulfoplanes formicivorans TaxID=1592317 RepID=A0A194AJA9_9BACT|nr:3'-5' exonuclease [Desulfoplanes formicivorans]GAU09141.1 3'-5' exonuclease [Desulfoplanes formicivorans]